MANETTVATPPTPEVKKELAKPATVVEQAPTEGKWSLLSRRDFLTRAAWAGFTINFLAATFACLRYMFPRVLFEPSPIFKAGFPNEYAVGEVNERFKQSQRVWIVRDSGGFYALLAICTHLGCTPNWFATEDKFKCPCHGSGFRRTGINFEGPAPRPLERIKITLAEDGQLLIDKSVKFLYEKGEWTKPGAYLPYSS
ncbi:MAG TPA: Rieske (2Fe-2S) protein [Candidatus Limnocylindrales bacterium]|nr:Rieske (2Fe-2S) protein [Candidatus Limnocylindrales bacterium]